MSMQIVVGLYPNYLGLKCIVLALVGPFQSHVLLEINAVAEDITWIIDINDGKYCRMPAALSTYVLVVPTHSLPISPCLSWKY